jgi:radical SAM superfamily enzyme YgiQ (UPF0313 family)
MISTNLMDDPYPVYPLGANLVAAAVRKSGHNVELFDLMVDGEEHLDAVMDRFKPDYIALAMRNVDNVSFNEPHSFIFHYKTLIEKVRQKSRVPIILGGSAYTIFPTQFLEYLGADFGIVGPGEVSLPKLLEQMEQNNPPSGRVINGEIDGSGENGYFLSREDRLADFYLNKGGMLNIHTKRGCPHHCLYCSYPGLEGNQYVFRRPSAIVDEIVYLKEQHRADFIFFTDSVFNDKDNRYLEIMEEMARRGLTIPWTCYLRPTKFDKDQVELMKQTGLYSVEWGTDCACDRTLAGMGKDFTWGDVVQATHLFAQYEIPGSHFIIFGGPGETPDTVREGIKNLEGLELSVVFGGMGVRIFPNTGICELAQRTGLIQNESQLFEGEIYYHSPQIDVGWLNNHLTETFKAKRHWLFPWAGVAERNSFMHNSGLRGPLWDLLLTGTKRNGRKNGQS